MMRDVKVVVIDKDASVEERARVCELLRVFLTDLLLPSVEPVGLTLAAGEDVVSGASFAASG